MTINKKHWYDGWFYDSFIAPNQDEAFQVVDSLIEGGASVLDVGTGTGRLLFRLADKCSRVDGIDLSITNVETAKRSLEHYSFQHVSIYHASIEDFFQEHDSSYDYAVISYVIHEIDVEKRASILVNLAAHVNKIIIVDYTWPQPNKLLRAFNTAVEFAAGRDHYRNFKSFMAGKGMLGLAERTKLTRLKELRNNTDGSQIVLLRGSLGD